MRKEGGRAKHFQELGSEESHTIESFERKIHGTPEVEPQRQYSCNTYTERRTYGRDENGQIVVKIEKDPKEPVRPVSPVRPATPVGAAQEEHLLRPVEPFDTLPLSIPRVDIRKNGGGSKPSISPRSVSSTNEQVSPHSGVSLGQQSSRSARSAQISPRSVSSTGSQTGVVPMKKVIRKSRWVSIHDGRPVSPYVETVHYEPKYYTETVYTERPPMVQPAEILRSRQVSYYDEERPPLRANDNVHFDARCAYIVENPLYRD